MLTKELITDLKSEGDVGVANFIKSQCDIGSIHFILKNLGQLPGSLNTDFLYDLLNHQHAQIRLHAVKNIGKLNGKADTKKLYRLYKQETNTEVRREIVSSIGRQRKIVNKPLLLDFLKDHDPKIVCQAIRGLLIFNNDKEITSHLKKLVNHPNEMVRAIIDRAYSTIKNKNKNHFPHTETYEFLKNVVVCGDVLNVLKHVPEESVHLTFTSPPYYNARDYSIYPSYQAYLDFLEKVFAETHRITKEDRFLIVNTSPIILP